VSTAVSAKPALPGAVVAVGRRRRRHRQLTVIALLVLALLLAWAVTLTLGERTFAPAVVWRVLGGEDIPGVSFTIFDVRLSKLIIGTLAGFAFGLGGVIFQTMLRNALASPDIIGISSGASAAAVVSITMFGLRGRAVATLAVVAGLAVACVVYLLAWRQGIHGSRLVLVGIGMGAILNGVVSWALTRGHQYAIAEAMRWLTGSLNSSFMEGVPSLLVPVAAIAPIALWLGSRLKALTLGDDLSFSLGISPGRVRLGLIVTGVGLVSVATAVTGPIAFVSFLAGPIAFRLLRNSGGLLVASGLFGALLVVVAEFVGQNLLGTRFPVGIVTAMMGAPYLVFLLIRANRNGTAL
jgi:iron complex transport system permease protein